MKVAAIVPSYNPTQHFPAVITGLIDAGFQRIYVVNDGSDAACLPYFQQAEAHPQCVVLTHAQNRGKGRALKTAMARHLSEQNGCVGVVTLDGDGQHAAADVLKVAQALEAQPNALVLGSRDFSQADVPAKSSLGNRITRTVFGWTSGLKVSDTQTGLRGIPNAFAEKLLDVSGERYEFETNMLLEARRGKVAIAEVPIATIYIDDNAGSHFRPVFDSLRIYFLILKFALSSLASAGVDLGLFTLIYYLLSFMAEGGRLFIATVAARVCSALFNFFVNRTVVFSSKARASGALLRYGILSVVQLFCSYGGTYLLSHLLPLSAVPAKIITDLILFCISFFIQRKWVFKSV